MPFVAYSPAMHWRVARRRSRFYIVASAVVNLIIVLLMRRYNPTDIRFDRLTAERWVSLYAMLTISQFYAFTLFKLIKQEIEANEHWAVNRSFIVQKVAWFLLVTLVAIPRVVSVRLVSMSISMIIWIALVPATWYVYEAVEHDRERRRRREQFLSDNPACD